MDDLRSSGTQNHSSSRATPAGAKVEIRPAGHCKIFWRTGRCPDGDACPLNHDVTTKSAKEEEAGDVPVPEIMIGENQQEGTHYQGILTGRPAPLVPVDPADHKPVEGHPHQEGEDHQLGGTLSALLDPRREKGRATEKGLRAQGANHFRKAR